MGKSVLCRRSSCLSLTPTQPRIQPSAEGSRSKSLSVRRGQHAKNLRKIQNLFRSQIASSSWTPSGRKIGSILATVLVEASDSTKIGASAAAQAAQTMSRNASKSSSGVQYPRFFLGRLLRASAAQRISSSEKFSMEIPLGTYRRSNPL